MVVLCGVLKFLFYLILLKFFDFKNLIVLLYEILGNGVVIFLSFDVLCFKIFNFSL